MSAQGVQKHRRTPARHLARRDAPTTAYAAHPLKGLSGIRAGRS
ncbi:MAG: hypothetical protein U0Q14_07165 [Dermatophilaceae bacterium]